MPGRAAPAPLTTEARLARYRATGDRRIRNEVVAEHRWLAEAIARRMRIHSEPLDDVVQVASVGVLKAAERFDPSLGVEFTSYAAVTARGEIRRYFRDATWAVRVPRRLHDLRYEVRAATDVLRERLRRPPRSEEVAEYLHVSVDDVVDCLCAESNYRPLSIDAGRGGDGSLGRDGGSEQGFAVVDSGDAFRSLVDRLPDRLRRIVEMRFVDQMKQTDIAAELGVSQVQVSRLLRQATARLRQTVEREAVGTTAEGRTRVTAD